MVVMETLTTNHTAVQETRRVLGATKDGAFCVEVRVIETCWNVWQYNTEQELIQLFHICDVYLYYLSLFCSLAEASVRGAYLVLLPHAKRWEAGSVRVSIGMSIAITFRSCCCCFISVRACIMDFMGQTASILLFCIHQVSYFQMLRMGKVSFISVCRLYTNGTHGRSWMRR